MNPGRELDLLIAEKIMGWRKVPEHEPPRSGWRNQSGYWVSDEGKPGDAWIPRYSTNLRLAWEVVEKMGTFFPDLSFSLEYYGRAKECEAQISWTDQDGLAQGTFYFLREDPAHAICEAALKVIGIE